MDWMLFSCMSFTGTPICVQASLKLSSLPLVSPSSASSFRYQHYLCPVCNYIRTPQWNKKLSYRRGTARRTMSVKILSTAAQLYENKPHLKRLGAGE